MKALVCIHGFGGLRTKDFDYLRTRCHEDAIAYFDFNIYDMKAYPNWRTWVKNAYRNVKEICDQGYEVTLLGFSMGGVIAGYLASRLPIHKLVLVAPAYFYFGISSGCRYISRLTGMGIRDVRALSDFVHARWLDVHYVTAFVELVAVLRSSVNDISIPVLILQASHDDIVPLYASRYAMHKIPHTNKQRCLFDGGNHEILNDEKLGEAVYLQIREFME